MLAVAMSVAFYRAHRLLARHIGGGALHGVQFRKDGAIAVLDGAGNNQDSGALIYCFVSSTLTTAIIAGQRRHYTLLAMPDSLPADDYRHLRVRLKNVIGRSPQ